MAKQPETRNGLSLLPIAVPEGRRVETYFTNASINGEPQTVSWSKPSAPDTWAAAFADPPTICTIQGTEPCLYGSDFDPRCIWCKRDMRRPPRQSFQPLDATSYQAILDNPPRAKLTCDRNGLDDPVPRACLNTLLDAANRHVATLNERIAVLEADNKALEDRKDALTERLDWMREHMRKWRTKALQRAIELATIKRHQSPHLPESEKPSQDAVWRNATRFSR